MNPALLDQESVYAALREVIDPEIGCNIVDLGLVYDVALQGAAVLVRMTLTTPVCPMSESLVWGVKQAQVELVWDPPWSPAMMTPAGQAAMGARPF
jgi:metal-sulfur cluster biosynthetic enzyme